MFTAAAGQAMVRMMICTRDLEGLPVVLKNSGRMLGRVLSADCRPGEMRLAGLVVEKNPPRCARRYLPWEAIAVLGRRVVVAKVPDGPMPRQLAGQRLVLGPDGGMMGFLRGFRLDSVTGRLLQAELAVSFWEDWTQTSTLTPADLVPETTGLRYHPPENDEKDGQNHALL